MLIKIIVLIAVKEVFSILYWICRGFWCDNRKMRRWILAGIGAVLTWITYLILRAFGFKHPIIWTALTSCLWSALYDGISSESSWRNG